MLRRLESGKAGVLCEWDAADGQVGVAFAGGREQGYERLEALQSFLIRETGITWVDLELVERHQTICGMGVVALIWRAQVSPPGGADLVAGAIGAALGVTVDP